MNGRFFSLGHHLTSRCAATAILGSLLATSAHAQTWDGGGVAGGAVTWNTAANWNPDGVPVNNGTANIIMAGTIDTLNTVDTNFDINGLTFNNTAGSFGIGNFGGAVLTIRGGGITNNDTQLQTFSVPITLGAGQTWNAAASDLTYTGTVNLNGNQLVLTGANSQNFAAITHATGSVVKNGSGGVNFNSSSSFGGGFTLNAGSVGINSATNAIGTGSVVLNGGSIESLGTARTVGNTLTLGGNFSSGGVLDLTFSGAATLTGDRTITATNLAPTIFSGAIGQDAAGRAFTKSGAGTLRFSGAAANTYTGTTNLVAGTLVLAKTAGVNAVAGSFLAVGDGAGGVNADVAQLGASNQILDATSVVVHTSGLFDLNGFAETLQQLQVYGGTVSTGAGTLTITSQVFHESAFNLTSNIAGNLSLGGLNVQFTIENGSPATDLNVSAAISNGSVTKTLSGTLEFSGASANTYSGTTTVNAGSLVLNKSDGVVAVAGDLAINSSATVNVTSVNQFASTSNVNINQGNMLLFNDNAINSLTISDGIVQFSAASALTVAGPINVNSNLITTQVFNAGGGTMVLTGAGNTITVEDGLASDDFQVLAAVNSTTGLTKTGAGQMTMSGGGTNAITGSTSINQGALVLAKDMANITALSGNIIIGDGVGGPDADILRLGQSHQIAQLVTETVTVNSSGFFDLNGRSEGIGNLQLNAGRVSGGTIGFSGSVTSSAQSTSSQINSNVDFGGSFTSFTVNDGTASDDLLMDGAMTNGSFSKTGLGTLRIAGANPNTASLTQLTNGTLILEKNASINALGGTQVIVGDGAGPAQSDVLRYGANDDQLPDSLQVMVQASGLFDLNGRSDTIGTLSINGSSVVQTGAGTLTIANQVTSELNATAGTINGNLNLAGGLRPFNIANATPAIDLTVTAAMSNGTLVKQGGGTLALTGSALTSPISYQVDSGTLSATALTTDATRSFTQNGGAFAGSLTNNGSFIYNAGSFGGQLFNMNTGTATFNANFTAVNGITNEGSITIAAGRVITASGNGLTNDGTIVLNGGTLQATATFNFITNDLISGHGELFASNVNFVNTGDIVVDGGDLAINSNFSPINSGTIFVPASLELQLPGAGNMQNSGLVLLSGGHVTGPGGLTNNLGGEIRGAGAGVDTPLSNSGGLIRATGSGTFTIAVLSGNSAGGELRIDDGATLNVQNSFSSSGTIVLTGAHSTSNGGAVTNTGTLRGLGRVNNVVANSGTIRAESGTLTFAAAAHTNAAAGRIEAGADTQVLYSQGLATNAGQIALTGGSFDNNNFAMNNPGFIAGYGTLRTGGLTNSGFINVGGSLDVLGAVTQNSVVSTQSGTNVRFFGPVSGPGSYPGPGTVMFLNSFSPGASPAAITFGGHVIFTGSNNLIMELAGTVPGDEYDTITSGGTAALGGTLDIDLLGGFVPSPGDSFQLITAAGGIAGTFSNVLLPSLSDVGWQLKYTTTSVLLQVGLKGDYNFDGAVNAADFLVWAKTFGTNGFGLPADGNGNNQIDPGDYTVWQNNFGKSFGGGASSSGGPDEAVPEPTSLTLLCSVALGVAVFTRRRETHLSQGRTMQVLAQRPKGPTVNSQGRQPLVTSAILSQAPTGRQ